MGGMHQTKNDWGSNGLFHAIIQRLRVPSIFDPGERASDMRSS